MTGAEGAPAPGRSAPRLLVITDAASCRARGRTVVETVRLIAGAASPGMAVVHRAKDTSPSARGEELAALVEIAQQHRLRLFAHLSALDDLGELLFRLKGSAGLAGLHLGGAVDAGAARGRVGPDVVLGASRHAGDALAAPAVAPLDYVTLSPLFTPTSKPDDKRSPLGVAGLSALLLAAAVPCLALGGVTPGSVRDVLAAGAGGVAVLGGVMAARDPAAAVSAYANALDDE